MLRKILKRLLVGLSWLLVAAVVLPLVAGLLLQIGAVQTFVVQRLARQLSERIGTELTLDRVDIAFFIKRRILDILNYEVTDVFASMGIDTSGGKFVFVPPKKKDPEKQVNIVCRLKNEAGLPISDDYLYEEFGIPKPDNYDEMKAAQQTAAAAIAAAVEEPIDGDGDEAEDNNRSSGKTEPKKNDRKFIDRMRDFFGRALADAGADSDW